MSGSFGSPVGWLRVALMVGAIVFAANGKTRLTLSDGTASRDESSGTQKVDDTDVTPSLDKAVPTQSSTLANEVVAAEPELAVGFPGVLLSGHAVELASPVEARVASVEVHMGDVVNSGQIVAQLDKGRLENELAITAAQHAVARAEVQRMTLELAEARRVVGSRTKLWRESLIAHDDLELAKHRRRQAESELRVVSARAAEMKARVRDVRERLNETQITAPFDGVVAERFVEAGATIGPDKPIVRIVSSSLPRVRFAVPEELATRVAKGMAVHVFLPGNATQLRGIVTRVAPELDQASSMLFAELELDPVPGVRLGRRPVRVYLGLAAH